jgi:NAD(P)-dependent dehydrogenase (short-subunit alcohol dehydrogenase family)
MRVRLKPLKDQVMVITGASSGIGLVTARRAAKAGARVVLAARNERDLAAAVNDIRQHGGEATHVQTDVSDPQQVDRLAEKALSAYGGIDSWVNNAAVSLYGRSMEVPLEDMHRLFSVNFFGVVHGCRSALPHLRENGGALITVGSVTGDRSLPLQGVYSAAKHAVKGFIDALRVELEEERVPVAVSLVKPASIATPFFEKARTYMHVEPRPLPPVYAPEVVAGAILACARRPIREISAGGAARIMSGMETASSRAADRYLRRNAFTGQMSDTPLSSDRTDNLYEPVAFDGGERSSRENWGGHVMERSLYTAASIHPRTTALMAIGAGVALAAGMRALRGRNGDEEDADY